MSKNFTARFTNKMILKLLNTAFNIVFLIKLDFTLKDQYWNCEKNYKNDYINLKFKENIHLCNLRINIIFQLDNESRMRSLRRSTFLSKLHVQRGNRAWFREPATPSAISIATQPAEDVQPEWQCRWRVFQWVE